MSRDESGLREPRAANGREMITLMRQGVIDALRKHKSREQSIVVWDHQARQVTEILPGEITIPEDAPDVDRD